MLNSLARWRAAALVITLCAALGLPAAAAAGTWTVGEIAGPSGTTNVVPRAVNINGVVVGTARFPGASQDTAFRWEDGEMIELANPGVESTVALDVNDAGVIVGYGKHPKGACASNPYQGVVWTATKSSSSASLTSFSAYLGAVDYAALHCSHGSWINGINNDGLMVGRAGANLGDGPFGPRIVDKPATTTGGGWSVLTLPDVITESSATIYGGEAFAISDADGIVGFGGPSGQRARVWNAPGPYPIELVAGAHGINSHGHVAGRTTATNYAARMWNDSGYVSLPSGMSYTEANAINDAGWVVGRAGSNGNQLQSATAMLWEVSGADVGASSLFTLAPSGWSMYSALDINEDGMIVGTGKHGSTATGYWMAPAAVAFELSGTVRSADGVPQAGLTIEVLDATGAVVRTAVTDAAGQYRTTLSRGAYAVRVAAPGFLPDAASGCTTDGGSCALNVSRNRTVDFYGTAIVVPPLPPGGGGAPGPGGGGAPAIPGPPVAWPKGGGTLSADAQRRVQLQLGPVGSGAAATLELVTKNAYAVKQQSAGKQQAGAGKQKPAPRKTKRPITLGVATAKFKQASKNARVRVRLSKSGYAFLRQRRSLKVVVKLSLSAPDGGITRAERVITLKAPKPRRR